MGNRCVVPHSGLGLRYVGPQIPSTVEKNCGILIIWYLIASVLPLALTNTSMSANVTATWLRLEA